MVYTGFTIQNGLYICIASLIPRSLPPPSPTSPQIGLAVTVCTCAYNFCEIDLFAICNSEKSQSIEILCVELLLSIFQRKLCIFSLLQKYKRVPVAEPGAMGALVLMKFKAWVHSPHNRPQLQQWHGHPFIRYHIHTLTLQQLRSVLQAN